MTQPVSVLQILATPALTSGQAGIPKAARFGEDFLPIFDSPSINFRAPVVFVGYGISDRSGGLDEYSGIDLEGKIALFLRGKPERYLRPLTHAQKVQTARQKGAVAYLTATGPVLSGYEAKRGVTGAPLAYYANTQESPQAGLPGAWISTSFAETFLVSSGRLLGERQEELSRTLRHQSTVTDRIAHLQWDSTERPGRLVNVIGLLPGHDRQIPNDHQDIVVIGAHRDHFGRQGGLLFPGADDNASGTAILLEVARVLAQSGMHSRRPIVFVSFSGEEQGLLGSRLYVSRPAHPLRQTLAMINVDHAGVGNGRLTVGVSEVPKSVIMEAAARAGVAAQVDAFGFFPGGDHVPFKEAGVPTVTVVSAGGHPHFHRPTDKADTVSPPVVEMTARYIATLVWHLANQ
jgi:hypothetical protein